MLLREYSVTLEQLQAELDSAQMQIMRIVMGMSNQLLMQARRIADLEAQQAAQNSEPSAP